MSKKITRSKLSLDRESVVTLQPNLLEAINGGVAFTGCDSACGQCGTGIPRPTNPNPNPITIGGPNGSIVCIQPATRPFK